MATKEKQDRNITVTQIAKDADGNPRFLARHESRRVQFTGETKDEAMDKLNAFLAAEE